MSTGYGWYDSSGMFHPNISLPTYVPYVPPTYGEMLLLQALAETSQRSVIGHYAGDELQLD